MAVTFRDLSSLDEFANVVRLERDIWGAAYSDLVPVPILAVSVQAAASSSARSTGPDDRLRLLAARHQGR